MWRGDILLKDRAPRPSSVAHAQNGHGVPRWKHGQTGRHGHPMLATDRPRWVRAQMPPSLGTGTTLNWPLGSPDARAPPRVDDDESTLASSLLGETQSAFAD